MFVNDRGRVRNISPSVALPDHVEVRIGILREPGEEDLEERVHVLARLPTPVDQRSIFVLVGEPDANGLIDEEDVKVLVPAVWVPRNVLSFVRDSAWSDLEQQPDAR